MRNFLKEEIKMLKVHMKITFTSLIIRQIQIKDSKFLNEAYTRIIKAHISFSQICFQKLKSYAQNNWAVTSFRIAKLQTKCSSNTHTMNCLQNQINAISFGFKKCIKHMYTYILSQYIMHNYTLGRYTSGKCHGKMASRLYSRSMSNPSSDS